MLPTEPEGYSEVGEEPAAAGATTSSATDSAPDASDHPHPERRLAIGVFAAFSVIFGVLSLLRLYFGHEPMTFDAGNYEYYTGYLEIHGSPSAIALPGQLESYLDPILNTVNYVLITNLPTRVFVGIIALLQTVPIVILAFAVWRVARTVLSSSVMPLLAGAVAGYCAFGSPIHLATLGETSGDVWLSVLPLVAVGILYQVLTKPEDVRAAYRKVAGAGAILGVASVLKFTEAAFAVAIGAGFLVGLLLIRGPSSWSYRRCAGLLATLAAVAGVIALGLYLPEGIMLWQRYRDPVYPFFNGVFHSPYLMRGSWDPGYAAHTPAKFWQLLVGFLYNHRTDSHGVSHLVVESPVLFFAAIICSLALVYDLIKRNRVHLVFLEVSFLLAYFLWAFVFGVHRYAAPMEMSAGALLLILLLLHDTPRVLRRVPRLLPLVASAAALGGATWMSYAPTIGFQVAWSSHYFGLPPHPFDSLKGTNVVLAGDAPLAFVVPQLPPGTQVVRAGGNLSTVVDDAWWTHVARVVHGMHRPWSVVFALGTGSPSIGRDLNQIGLTAHFGACHPVLNVEVKLEVCRLDRIAV